MEDRRKADLSQQGYNTYSLLLISAPLLYLCSLWPCGDVAKKELFKAEIVSVKSLQGTKVHNGHNHDHFE